MKHRFKKMKTVLKYLVCLFILGGFVSCDKDTDAGLKKSKLGQGILDSRPLDTGHYLYEDSNGSGFIELALAGFGWVSDEGVWQDDTEFMNIDYRRSSKSNHKIKGAEEYQKEYPEENLEDFSETIPIKDYKNSEFRLDPKRLVFLSQDVLSLKMSEEKGYILLTLQTPLRAEDGSPATYKLKYIPFRGHWLKPEK